ncbi:metabolite traffic protein EboE [Nocardioides sp. P5_E3]
MLLQRGLGHLTYSTLVHPGDTWPEMWESLRTFVPLVKARVSPDAPFGVSLRLSGSSAATLAGSPDLRAELREFLTREQLYVYTVNAFPHGPFKGRTVMEDVYEPDWSTQARLDYTTQVADVLADIAAPGVRPTIQTAPLAFRANVVDEAYVQSLVEHLVRAVAHLVMLEERTGVQVAIALEPEPACWLETTAETVRFFEERIYAAEGRTALARLTGQPLSRVEDLLRRHLGVVFDICHQSVGFEDIGASLQSLVDAGVPILKLQAASALRVPQVSPEVVAELDAFTDTIYLSQTTERRDGAEIHHLHLADAIADYRRDPGSPREWRTHFHLPVFLDDLGSVGTTRSGIEDAMRLHVATPLSEHLEIETYTWDVLPAHLKTGDIVDYVTRELEWVLTLLLGE